MKRASQAVGLVWSQDFGLQIQTITTRSNIYTPIYEFVGKTAAIIPAKSKCKEETKNILSKTELLLYTDGSRTENDTRAAVFGEAPSVENYFALDSHAIEFQAEIFTILKCESENLRNTYKRKQIHILLDNKLHWNNWKTSRKHDSW